MLGLICIELRLPHLFRNFSGLKLLHFKMIIDPSALKHVCANMKSDWRTKMQIYDKYVTRLFTSFYYLPYEI